MIGYRTRVSWATLSREVTLLFFVTTSPHDLSLQILLIVVVVQYGRKIVNMVDVSSYSPFVLLFLRTFILFTSGHWRPHFPSAQSMLPHDRSKYVDHLREDLLETVPRKSWEKVYFNAHPPDFLPIDIGTNIRNIDHI